MRTAQLIDGRTITLNSEQEQALSLMEQWHASSSLYFLLAGYAGTGKTTLTYEFIKYLASKGIRNVGVTAPTHKAKKVIAQSTGLPGSTIQSILGLGLDTDVTEFDPNSPKFKQVKEPEMHKYRYLVIDEASMISEELFKYIIQTSQTCKTRILFMGDKAQLPPVNEVVSKVFQKDNGIDYKFQLTKVERQAGDNPLMSIYDGIRNNLKATRDTFKKVDNFTEAGEGIRFLHETPFNQEVMKSYASENFDPCSVKVLCWTNNEVAIWNKAIRKQRMDLLHPGKPIGAVAVGDLLMAYATREKTIINSSEYLIESAKLRTKEFEIPGAEPGERIIETLHYIHCEVSNVDTGEKSVLPILNPRDRKAIALWKTIYFDKLNRAKSTKNWSDFFSFRGAILLLENVQTGMREVAKDLDFGYAITVHKSQGSTYDEVFVIERDINKNRRNVERNQLKYVALSRPRKRAILLT